QGGPSPSGDQREHHAHHHHHSPEHPGTVRSIQADNPSSHEGQRDARKQHHHEQRLHVSGGPRVEITPTGHPDQDGKQTSARHHTRRHDRRKPGGNQGEYRESSNGRNGEGAQPGSDDQRRQRPALRPASSRGRPVTKHPVRTRAIRADADQQQHGHRQ